LGSFLDKGLRILAVCSGQNLKMTPGERSLVENTKVLKERLFQFLKEGHQGMKNSQAKSSPEPNSTQRVECILSWVHPSRLCKAMDCVLPSNGHFIVDLKMGIFNYSVFLS
jgi:hypothetical protein